MLWLFGPEDNVTEAGASNFFVIMRNKETKRVELLTPPLGDIILDGVTRRSVLELASERLAKGGSFPGTEEGLDVVERQITMGELVEASKEGRLLEACVTGTAVSSRVPILPVEIRQADDTFQFFIAPVGTIRYKDADISIGKVENGVLSAPFTLQIRDLLRKIMYGEEDNKWAYLIEEKV